MRVVDAPTRKLGLIEAATRLPQLCIFDRGPDAVGDHHYRRIYVGHLRQKLEYDPARQRNLLNKTGV